MSPERSSCPSRSEALSSSTTAQVGPLSIFARYGHTTSGGTHQQILESLSRALLDRSITVPEFLAGAAAFKLLSVVGRDRAAAMRAWHLIQIEPADQTKWHPKVVDVVNVFETADDRLHPIRERATARHLGIAPAYLGFLLAQQTGHAWADWSGGAHLRATLLQLSKGDRTVAGLARQLGWSSREQLHHRFHDAFGLGPATLIATLHACNQ